MRALTAILCWLGWHNPGEWSAFTDPNNDDVTIQTARCKHCGKTLTRSLL